jgi:hypothetical protein
MMKIFFSALLLAGLVTAGNGVFAQTSAALEKPGAAGANKTGGADGGASEPKKQRQIPDTLMYTIDELTDIRNRTSVEQTAEGGGPIESSAIENASLYLSTIVYSGPTEWTIWVNGKPITPNQELLEFKITDIGPRFVELLVPLSAQGMRPVRLEPNQTFISKSGTVVEGAWR